MSKFLLIIFGISIINCANPLLLSTEHDKYFGFSVSSTFINIFFMNEIKLILIGSEYKEEIKGPKSNFRFEYEQEIALSIILIIGNFNKFDFSFKSLKLTILFEVSSFGKNISNFLLKN